MEYLHEAPKAIDWTAAAQRQLSKDAAANAVISKEEFTMDSCDICSSFPCDALGERTFARSRAYEGTGERVRRVLQKASQGETVKVGILGGSVSLGYTKCNCPKDTWHYQVITWFKSEFPQTTIIHNDGSVRARGTNYFSLCHAEHLDQDVDIVFLEHGVNDMYSNEAIVSTERLVRSLLEYPNKPAVVFVATMPHKAGKQLHGMDVELTVANYYDVPMISMRNAVFTPAQEKESLRHHLWGDEMDGTHLVLKGHQVLANLVSSYLAQQKCFMDNGRELSAASDPLWINENDIPLQPIYGSYNPDKPTSRAPLIQPKCDSIDSQRHPLVPSSSTDWEKWVQPGGKMGDPNQHKSYWRSSKPGAQISFQVETTIGDIMIYYLRSKSYGLGDAKCWIDDASNKAVKIVSYWPYDYTVGE